MSQYSDNEDACIHAGTAEHPGSLSLSTCAANQQSVLQEFDIFSDAFLGSPPQVHFGRTWSGLGFQMTSFGAPVGDPI